MLGIAKEHVLGIEYVSHPFGVVCAVTLNPMKQDRRSAKAFAVIVVLIVIASYHKQSAYSFPNSAKQTIRRLGNLFAPIFQHTGSGTTFENKIDTVHLACMYQQETCSNTI